MREPVHHLLSPLHILLLTYFAHLFTVLNAYTASHDLRSLRRAAFAVTSQVYPTSFVAYEKVNPNTILDRFQQLKRQTNKVPEDLLPNTLVALIDHMQDMLTRYSKSSTSVSDNENLSDRLPSDYMTCQKKNEYYPLIQPFLCQSCADKELNSKTRHSVLYNGLQDLMDNKITLVPTFEKLYGKITSANSFMETFELDCHKLQCLLQDLFEFIRVLSLRLGNNNGESDTWSYVRDIYFYIRDTRSDLYMIDIVTHSEASQLLTGLLSGQQSVMPIVETSILVSLMSIQLSAYTRYLFQSQLTRKIVDFLIGRAIHETLLGFDFSRLARSPTRNYHPMYAKMTMAILNYPAEFNLGKTLILYDGIFWEKSMYTKVPAYVHERLASQFPAKFVYKHADFIRLLRDHAKSSLSLKILASSTERTQSIDILCKRYLEKLWAFLHLNEAQYKHDVQVKNVVVRIVLAIAAIFVSIDEAVALKLIERVLAKLGADDSRIKSIVLPILDKLSPDTLCAKSATIWRILHSQLDNTDVSVIISLILGNYTIGVLVKLAKTMEEKHEMKLIGILLSKLQPPIDYKEQLQMATDSMVLRAVLRALAARIVLLHNFNLPSEEEKKEFTSMTDLFLKYPSKAPEILQSTRYMVTVIPLLDCLDRLTVIKNYSNLASQSLEVLRKQNGLDLPFLPLLVDIIEMTFRLKEISPDSDISLVTVSQRLFSSILDIYLHGKRLGKRMTVQHLELVLDQYMVYGNIMEKYGSVIIDSSEGQQSASADYELGKRVFTMLKGSLKGMKDKVDLRPMIDSFYGLLIKHGVKFSRFISNGKTKYPALED